MITKISHLTLYTDDLEKAKNFYVDKIGFKVHTDTHFGEDRWLTLCPALQTDFELILLKASDPEAQALVGKQASKDPFFCLETDDCQGDYEMLKAKGVTFVQEPKQEGWGTTALFKDLHGNLIYMVQP